LAGKDRPASPPARQKQGRAPPDPAEGSRSREAVYGPQPYGRFSPETGEPGDFIDPGQARFVIVGESKVEDAIKHAVTRAEKQTAQELDVDPKDVGKAL
jgi:hypothetical protein